MSIMSEEQKIIDLENENSFLKDNLYEKQEQNEYLKDKLEKQQKEIEEKNIAINKMSKDISRQLEEIEEKSTIIMAGAEKVKRLESQIEELLIVLNNEKKINYIKPIDIKIQNYISEDEIRELIKKYQEIAEDVKQKYKGTYAYRSDYLEALAKIEGYQELLEEK